MTEPRGSRWTLALLCLLVWATRMVLPGDLVYSELDTSWCLALGHALEHRWRAGVDYVFTFGPLGFLSTGAYVPGLVGLKIFVWEGAFQLLGAVALTMAGAGIRNRLLRAVYFVAVVCSPLDVDSHAFLTIVAAFAWMTRTRSFRGGAAAIGAVLLAGLSLVKFTYAAATLVGVLAATWSFWSSGSRRLAAMFLVGFVAVSVVAWWMCGQSLADAPAYLARSMQLSGAYSEAMSSVAPSGTVAVALVLLVAAAVAASLHRSVAALAHLGWIWIAYKAGFVRAEDHTPVFFLYGAVAPLLLDAAGGSTAVAKTVSAAVRLACVALAVLGMRLAAGIAPSALRIEISDPFHRVAAHVRDLVHPIEFSSRMARDVPDDAWMTDLPRTRAIVGTSTIDMVSFLQIALFRNGLRWSPRPVFQSYAALTPELADMNARFYASARAPEFVLFYLQTIDSRLPTMDDAAVLAILARDYEPVLREKGFLLLRRSPRAGSAAAAETVLERDGAFGETIDLRGVAGRCTLLRLDIRPTLAGRLWTMLDAAPPLFAEFGLDDGSTAAGRIVPDMMRGGVVVDPMIRTEKDWLAWYTGKPLPHPVSLRILPPDRAWMYEPRIGVRLVREDAIVPPARPGLEAALTYSVFAVRPVDVVSDRNPVRDIVQKTDVLRLSATSKMIFDVSPGSHQLTATFGLVAGQRPGTPSEAAVFSAVLVRAGAEDRVLFERRLDPRHVEEERKLQTLAVPFTCDAPAQLELRAVSGPRAEAARDAACWSAIGIE
jgi:hypothetical protein